MHKIVFVFLGFLILINLTGCETVKGLGKDITSSSSAVQSILTSNKQQQASKYFL